MKIQSVFDEGFRPYGRVVEGYDFGPLLAALRKSTPRPAGRVIYVPSAPELESLPIYAQLRDRFYGGMPLEIGYCNGDNRKLGCLEYHRDSELDVMADDVVLLLAPLQAVREGRLDTSRVEAFLARAGTAVQLYETTLHYAPVTPPGGQGFRVVIALPRGTNLERPNTSAAAGEDRLLWARNKWLLAHPDSVEASQGAWVGLTGENITIE